MYVITTRQCAADEPPSAPEPPTLYAGHGTGYWALVSSDAFVRRVGVAKHARDVVHYVWTWQWRYAA